MQHSFKFIHKVVIVIVIMIVVTLGLYVMRQTQGFVNTVNLSKSQINEFNAKWTGYEMLQKGSTLKGLFLKLAINAEQNNDNPQMLIDVAYNTTEGSEFNIITSTVKNLNVSKFREAMGRIDVKHAYTVELIYNEKTGIIIGIIIKNGRNDRVDFVPDES